jgi:hypothetical protein
MLGAYLGVFLIKVCHWRPIWIAFIEIALAWIVIFTSGRISRIANRLGIPAFLGATAGICALINLLWGLNIHKIWILWIFMIIIYNGISGLLASGQGALENGSTTLFAPVGRHELSIGLGALARAVGTFSGSCIASGLFVLLPGGEEDKLQKFFILCSIMPFLVFLIYAFSYRTSIYNKVFKKK